jgi:hypothetical protein
MNHCSRERLGRQLQPWLMEKTGWRPEHQRHGAETALCLEPAGLWQEKLPLDLQGSKMPLCVVTSLTIGSAQDHSPNHVTLYPRDAVFAGCMKPCGGHLCPLGSLGGLQPAKTLGLPSHSRQETRSNSSWMGCGRRFFLSRASRWCCSPADAFRQC